MEATLDLSLIPYSDILEFLNLNNQFISEDPQSNYQSALQLIYSEQKLEAPPSVSDLIIAYNLRHLTLPNYKVSDIILAQDISRLQELADTLLLPDIDKERILRVLGFLGHLENDQNIFTDLPMDVLNNILSYVDCSDILLLCRLSTKLSQFCNQNLGIILQNRLRENFKIDIQNYTTQQLRNLCKLTQVRTFTGPNLSIILNKNTSKAYGRNAKNLELRLNQIPNIQYIAIGSSYWLVLNTQGLVYGWGNNYFGEAGLDPNRTKIDVPTLIPNLTNIIQIDTKGNSSLVLTREGTVYAFGNNAFGQLGLGHNQPKNMPTLIQNLDRVIQIATSGWHSLVLLSTGQVYGFGANDSGQLGLNDIKVRNIPTLIENLENIVQVAAGAQHSLFLMTNGNVYACGSNQYGQLGLLRTEVEFNDNKVLIPTLIRNILNIRYITCGIDYSLVLDNVGQVYGFGNNTDGQLGLGDNKNRFTPTLNKAISNIIRLTVGQYHCVALDINGKIYGFGSNNDGQIGTGTKIKLVPSFFAQINI